MPNHYYTSTGEKFTKPQVDRKIRAAKKEKHELFIEEHGYIFCEDCGKNDCIPIDTSHEISVDKCQKEGRTELAWDVKNMKLRGRPCHQKKDGLNLQFENHV